MRSFLAKIFTIFIFCFSAFALSPEEKLPNEDQERRAMEMFLEVRCLVCNGQVIENSDTEFSFLMRKNIRQKIAAGKSDEEIRNELVREFGEDILTRPSGFNRIILWGLPLIFAALLSVFLVNKKSTASSQNS
jgi:cytochrome c-type biogenesis protein CcmH